MTPPTPPSGYGAGFPPPFPVGQSTANGVPTAYPPSFRPPSAVPPPPGGFPGPQLGPRFQPAPLPLTQGMGAAPSPAVNGGGLPPPPLPSKGFIPGPPPSAPAFGRFPPPGPPGSGPLGARPPPPSFAGPPPPMTGAPLPPPPGATQHPPPPMGFAGGPPPPPAMSGIPPPPSFGVPPRTAAYPPAARPVPGPGTGAQPVQQQNRIDPSQMPRPPPQKVQAESFLLHTRVDGTIVAPPPAASKFIVRDTGNCSPRYIRSTLYSVPFSNELLSQAGMPLALVISPLALPDPEDESLQVVDASYEGPIRCSRCKAYMNPYMQWTNGGRTFTCNFCRQVNATPDAYFCHLGPDGRRTDTDVRPELSRGSVEFLVSKEYLLRPPQAPAHVFLIDVSPSALQSGITAAICGAVSRAIDCLQGGSRCKVGLVTYDTAIHFYAFKVSPTSAAGAENGADDSESSEAETSSPQILVVGDIADPYAPAGTEKLLIQATAAARRQFKAFLGTLPQLWGAGQPSASTNALDSCALAAVESCVELLRPLGGKVHSFLSCLPNLGHHALKAREPLGGGDREKLSTLQPQVSSLTALAASAADAMVCVDVSVLSPAGYRHCDVASLATLPAGTGGSLATYTPFSATADYDQLVNDLIWNVSRMQGLEAVMRIRCSAGLDVAAASFSGHCHRPPGAGPDLFLPAVDCDKAIAVRLALLEKLPVNGELYVQAALLYTDTAGRRLVRVHTLALGVTDNVSTAFKYADLDAQINVLARRVAGAMPGSVNLGACREVVNTGVVTTLSAYRKHCASGSSAVQLILPEALKLLPLYALSLLKGSGLRDGVRLDERSLWMTQMLSLPPARVSPLLYPRLVALQPLLSAAAAAAREGRADGEDALLEGAAAYEGLTLSSEQLQTAGIYLLENGVDAYLYFDAAASPAIIQALLGVQTYEEFMRLPPTAVPTLTARRAGESAGAVTAALGALLGRIRQQRSSFMRLRVARKGDPAEMFFLHMLVEDRTAAGSSYVEYLCQVHRLIQTKLS